MVEVGKNLKRVRLLKNLSLIEAGKLLNMSAPAVSKYEKGEIVPNSQKLIEFANAYNVKVLELLKSYNTPELKFTAFRKKQRLQGKKLELLKDVISNDVGKYIEVVELNSFDPKTVRLKKYSCRCVDDAEKAAISFRKDYEIANNQPLSDLTNFLENLGIIIIQIKNSNNAFSDFDGLSEVVNGIPTIVILDDINDGARQRFTIVHELGHLVLDIKNKDLDEEKICHRFASALLMPKEAIFNEFGVSRNKISFYELEAFKLEYKVSIAATLYRLKDLKVISEYLFTELNKFLSMKGYKKEEPFPISLEKTYQFKKIVHRLESDDIISLNKACELLGTTIDEYNNEDNNYRY